MKPMSTVSLSGEPSRRPRDHLDFARPKCWRCDSTPLAPPLFSTVYHIPAGPMTFYHCHPPMIFDSAIYLGSGEYVRSVGD